MSDLDKKARSKAMKKIEINAGEPRVFPLNGEKAVKKYEYNKDGPGSKEQVMEFAENQGMNDLMHGKNPDEDEKPDTLTYKTNPDEDEKPDRLTYKARKPLRGFMRLMEMLGD